MPKLSPVLVASLLTLAGCGDDSKPPPPSTAASALTAAAVAESKTLVHLVVDSSGSATFDMKAPLENIKGTVKGFGGELEVDLADLKKSRGKVTIDVTTLETHTFGEDEKDNKQSEHARTWLEVGPKTAADKKDKYKQAEFAIREIENPSANDVTKMTGDSRSVTLTAKGDFLLHGQSVVIAAELSCAFQYEGATFKSVACKSAKPAMVNLKAHKVEARDDAGEAVIAKTLELFGKKVADDASVTFELTARPKGSTNPLLVPPATATPSGSATASAAASGSAAPSGTASATAKP